MLVTRKVLTVIEIPQFVVFGWEWLRRSFAHSLIKRWQ